jgi:hypothetical protein
MNKKQKRVNKKHKRSVERVKRKARASIANAKTVRRTAPPRKKKTAEAPEASAA